MADHAALSVETVEHDPQPAGFALRHFRGGDLPELANVICRAADADGSDAGTSMDELQVRFARPYFLPEQNCFVACLEDGTLAGYTTAELDPRDGMGWGSGCVDPRARRRGIGRALIRVADARHVERVRHECAPGTSLTITRYCLDSDAASRTLLASEGYAVARASFFLRIDFPTDPDVPPLPPGLVLRPFVSERDANAVWKAEQEFFRDAWGRVESPFEVWRSAMFLKGHQDPLWIVAMAGDVVAGVCLTGPKSDDPSRGWIHTLGVGSLWRRRGLGTTLLAHGLNALQAHGFAGAGLEVDAENSSGAVALYERVGMRVERRYLIHRKTVAGVS